MLFHQDRSLKEADRDRRRILTSLEHLAERGQIKWPPDLDGERAPSPEMQEASGAHLGIAAMRPLEAMDEEELIGLLESLASLARREGILALEREFLGVKSSILKEGTCSHATGPILA